MRGFRPLVAALPFALALAGCGSDEAASDDDNTSADASTPAGNTSTGDSIGSDDTDAASSNEQRFPDVIDATAEFDGTAWTVAATLSSPYDSAERYANAWRIIGPDGTVYGERVLTHDHAGEQPFTRSQSGIEIPDGVDMVTIEGRDQQYGWGGDTFELSLSR